MSTAAGERKARLYTRRRIRPRLYDFCYVYCRSHLETLRQAIPLVYQANPAPVVLDIGCGSKPFQVLFPGARYLGVDLDRNSAADHIVDCNCERLPLADASVDLVLLSNTLEHVYETAHLVGEIRRVLKPGGLLFFSAPMTFPVHAHPDDYHRFTPYFYRRLFRDWDIVALNGTNSAFSVPLLLLSQMLGGFLPGWLNFLPIALLNLLALAVDALTRALVRLSGVAALRRDWESCPIDVNGIVRKRSAAAT